METLNIHDEMIRDRIVVGIADAELSKKLQLQSNLTQSKAVEMVRTYKDIFNQYDEQRPKTGNIDRVQKSRHLQQPSYCGRCGGNLHLRSQCPARMVECHKCSRRGHYAQQRRSNKQKAATSSSRGSRPKLQQRGVRQVDADPSASDSHELDFRVGCVQKTVKVQSNEDDDLTIFAHVGGILRKFEIDTGANETVAPLSYENLWFNVLKPDIRLRGPGKKMLVIHVVQEVPISYNGRTTIQKVYLIHDHDDALLGKQVFSALKQIERVGYINKVSIKRSSLVEDQFQHLYRAFGDLLGEYNITLTADAKPFAITTPRRIPIPL